MNPMSLLNVSIAKSLHGPNGEVPTLSIPTQLSELMWTIASTYPTWEVRIVAASSLSVRKVKVFQGGECLGELGIDYFGSVKTVYVVNQRIAASRERNNGRHFSENNKRLMSSVKKYFFRKTLSETVDGALEATGRALNSTVWELSSKVSKITSNLSEPAISYVLGAGRELFAQHLAAIGMPQHIAKLDELTEAELMAKASVNIKDLYDKKRMALVILDNDKYIVKYAVNTEVHNHTSFPESLRRSLGMLKLVDNGQIISNSGMRVDDNVFILVQDEAGANNV